MFSQRFIYGSVIAFLFLLVIYQGILLLRVNANSGTGKTVIQSREAEGAASLRAGILSSDVQVLLDEVAGSKICHADMYVITPPESCRACAMQQSAFIFDAGQHHSEIHLFVPQEEVADYRAFFSEGKNIVTESYIRPESSWSDLLQSLSGNYILMKLESGRVKGRHVFLCQKC